MLELTSSIQYLKGVGPRLAEMLSKKGIHTVEDLLYYLPFRYEDRINPKMVEELRPGETASVIAEVRTVTLLRTRRPGFTIFELTAGQGRGCLTCLWFQSPYLKDVCKPGQRIALYGKVETSKYGRHRLEMLQPQFEILGEDLPDSQGAASGSLEVGRIVPIYESAAQQRLSSRWFRKIIFTALTSLPPEIPDGIPPVICQRLALIGRRQAFEEVHFPKTKELLADLESARSGGHRRLIFEELFFLELGLELKRKHMQARTGIAFRIDDGARQAVKKVLHFHPTNAQKRVLKEIVEDMQRPMPMRRLLQGDVGSGKTIVALQAAVIAMESGYQAALMAPTEILATQHYLSARKFLADSGYQVVLLTGSQEQGHKRTIRGHIARGHAHLVIGTHALIQEKVEFHRLGLVIVDEQHRFGVLQRFRLMKKPGQAEPDVLVMTATPIPRTLALTLYGDLDTSTLDEFPPGRTPIVTRRIPNERASETWEFVRKQVRAGHQAYVVYPVIEGGKNEPATGEFAGARRGSELKAAIKMYDELRSKHLPELKIGLLHGRMSSEDKDDVMRRFEHGQIEVLVSTTVIEVGVDVPNANLMVIEHAERFGLAQLHQLRGRIGRGSAKSYCILMTGGKITPPAEKRLDTMVRTQNGFEIAELDLQLRGPGEFFGTRQAGAPNLRVANLWRDRQLLELAKQQAALLVSGKDSQISREEAERVIQHLKSHWQRRYGLVEVG